MKHKWHKEIKAWADGAIIECQNAATGEWEELEVPYWYESNEYKYRIKSQPKEPQYMYVYRMAGQHNVEFRFWDTKTDAPTYVGKIKLEVDDD
jgi:hypothetical protein